MTVNENEKSIICPNCDGDKVVYGIFKRKKYPCPVCKGVGKISIEDIGSLIGE